MIEAPLPPAETGSPEEPPYIPASGSGKGIGAMGVMPRPVPRSTDRLFAKCVIASVGINVLFFALIGWLSLSTWVVPLDRHHYLKFRVYTPPPSPPVRLTKAIGPQFASDRMLGGKVAARRPARNAVKGQGDRHVVFHPTQSHKMDHTKDRGKHSNPVTHLPARRRTVAHAKPGVRPHAVHAPGHQNSAGARLSSLKGTLLVAARAPGDGSAQGSGNDNQGDGPPGDGTGLLGQYYTGQNFEHFVFQRADPNIDFIWTNRMVDAHMPPNTAYSVRWRGQIQAQATATVTFYTDSDDGVRLWVNGQPLIDDWSVHGESENKGQVTLQAGHRYDFRLEYFEKNGFSNQVIELYWEWPGHEREFVPQSQFYPPNLP